MFFVEEKEPIAIDNSWTYGCNRCVICNNNYKHSRLWWGVGDTNGSGVALGGIFELREKIAHPTCIKIVNDIKKNKYSKLSVYHNPLYLSWRSRVNNSFSQDVSSSFCNLFNSFRCLSINKNDSV